MQGSVGPSKKNHSAEAFMSADRFQDSLRAIRATRLWQRSFAVLQLFAFVGTLLLLSPYAFAQSVSLSPTTLSFGNQIVNTASASKNISLQNTGSVPLTISSIVVTGSFSQTNTCGTSVAAKKSCAISATFTPTATGTLAGTIIVSDNASNSPQTVNLAGVGVLAVSVSSQALSFGSQILATTSAAKSVTLTNNQSIALTVASIVPTGDFAQTNTCGISVGPSGSCTINITFTPTAASTRTGAITTTDSANNSPQVISLTGTGISASLTSITIAPSSPSLPANSQLQLAATGNYNNGTTQNLTTSVTWTSSNKNVATISATGLASGLAQGVSTIKATLGSISVSITVTVTPALLSVSVTPSNSSIPAGTVQQFTATGTYTGGSTQNLTNFVFWSSSNTGVASVNSSGLAGNTHQGTTTITAASGTVTGSTVLTVAAPSLVSIAVTPSNASITSGTTQQFIATGTYSDSSTQNLTNSVSWSSSNTGVASVNSSGLAGNTHQGTTTITATSGTATGSTVLTVTAPTLVSIAVTPSNASISSGTTQQFTATGTYSDGSTQNLTTQVSWASSSSSNATISSVQGSNGLATGVAQGTTTVSATLGSISGTTLLTVTPAALVSIAISPSSASVAQGVQQQFTATGTFTDGSTQNITATVAWSSSSTSIATISNASGSQGLATSLAQGPTTITAASGSVTNSVTLTVLAPALVSIAVNPNSPFVALGTTQQFTATGTYTDGSTQDLTASATWNSSAANVASISNVQGMQGLATSMTVGSSTITATANSISGSTLATVTPAVIVSISINPSSASIPIGTTQQFAAIGTFSDGSTQDLTSSVSWSAGNGTVATISNSAPTQGLATPVGQGVVQVTATLSSINGSAQLTITAAVLQSIAVTPANPSLALGTTQQFVATGTFSDGSTQALTSIASWTSSNSAVANVTGNGLVSGAGPGSSTITATSGSISGSTTITFFAVTPTLVSIAVTPANPSLALGTTQQFAGTGTFSDGSTQDLTTSVAWTSSNPSVASVSSGGLASGAGPGSSTITASSGSISGSTIITFFAAAPTLVSIAVTPANPSISAGTTQQFTATGTYSDGGTQNLTTQVSWASSSTANATISNVQGSNGLATGVAQGSATMTATLGSINGSTLLTVTPAALVSIAISPSSTSVAQGVQQQFTVTGMFTDGSTQNITATVLWSSSSISIATISNGSGSQGQATSLAQGQTTITAASGSVTNSVTLTVLAPALVSIAVNPNNPSIASGTSQQFTATGTYTDGSTQDLTTSSTWNSSADNVASISDAQGMQGLVTSSTQGSSTITATANSVSGSTLLTVTPAVIVSISIDPPSASIPLGAMQQFTAAGNFSDGSTQDLTGSVSWSAGDGTVATISNSVPTVGWATPVTQGSVAVMATLNAITGVAQLIITAPALQSIAVTPANPTIALGTTQQFTATGTYSDGSTQDLTNSATWTSSNSSAASVTSSGLVSGAGAGTSTITATSGSIAGSTTIAFFAVTPTLVSITVTPANPMLALGTTQQFAATGTFSDGSTLDVTSSATWTSSNSAVANVTSSGLASGAGPGTSAITASLGSIVGSTTITFFAAAPTLLSIAVTPTNPSISVGTTQQLTATGTYSDGSTQNLTTQVSWASSSSLNATISNVQGSIGLATGVAQGFTTMTATFSSISGSTLLTVTPAALVSIAISPSSASVAQGVQQQFIATGTFTDGSTQNVTTTVAWNSSSPLVATISNASGSQGLASSFAQGPTTITATSGSVTNSVTLTVLAPFLVSITVNPNSPFVALGTTQQFTATGTYTDGSTQDLTTSATWSSSAANVASIGNVQGMQGLATTMTVGSSTITATANSLSGGTLLTVTPAVVVSISVNPPSASIPLGATQQFAAVGTFSDSSTQDLTNSVSWSAGNGTVATISNSAPTQGLAKPVGQGAVQVTATLNSVSGSAPLTITPAALQSIAVTPANPTLALGMTQQFAATGTFSDGSTQDLTSIASWNSSNASVANITSSGLVSGAGLGSSTITTSVGLISGSTTITFFAAAPTLVSIAVTPTNRSISTGTMQQFAATGTYSDGSTQNLTTQVSWVSSCTANATISNVQGSIGLATGVAQGATTVSATLGSISGSTLLTVTPAALVSIAISPSSASVAQGVQQQFSATGTFTDASVQNITASVLWSSFATSIATISNASGSQGLAASLAQGPATITASSGSVTTSVTLMVLAPVLLSIAETPSNVSDPLGTSQQFTATGTYSNGNTQNLTSQVVWSSSSPIVSITNNQGNGGFDGVATTLAPGSTTITATLGSVAGSTLLTVTPVALVSIAITPSPASIGQGIQQQFTATGTFSDGSTQNITATVAWSTSSVSIATVSNASGTQGLALGIALGTVTVTASQGNVIGSDQLVVVPSQYGTYIGSKSGAASNSYNTCNLVDNSTGDYIAWGASNASDYPTQNAYQPSKAGPLNGILTAINSTTGVIHFSTYLGGSGSDSGTKCAQDSSGNIYVTGFTNSTNFPHTVGSGRPSGASAAPFVAEFSPSGSLVFSAVYGHANSAIHSNAITLDGSGNIWLAGDTNYNAVGGIDAWVLEVSPTGSLIQEVSFGGTQTDVAETIAIFGSTIYVAGYTNSSQSQNFPVTSRAFETTCGLQCTETPPSGQCASLACGIGFIATFNTSGVIQACTYLGGASPVSPNLSMELVTGIAVDGSGDVYATGTTSNTDFPTAGTPLQSTLAGMIGTNSTYHTAGCLGTYPGGLFRSGTFPCGDAFVAELNPALTTELAGTYIGGSGTDVAFSILLDSGGHPWISGMTQYPGGGNAKKWPTTSNAFQLQNVGGVAMFITELASNLQSLIYSTYFGGGPDQWSYSLALTASGNPVFGGLSDATAAQGGSTPTSSNAIQSQLQGSENVFIAALSIPPN